MEEQQALANSSANSSTPEATLRIKPDKKGCSTFACSKWSLLIYAVFFLLIGAILLAIGIWAEVLRRQFGEVNQFVATPAIILILVGVFIVLVAFLGIIGGCIHHAILLKIFLVGVILMFLLQIVVGILAFVYREEGAVMISSHLEGSIKAYSFEDDITKAVDSLQENLKCCGFRGYKDWEKNENFNCSAGNKGPYSCSVPESCCTEAAKAAKKDKCGQTMLGKIADKSIINSGGCEFAFKMWIEENLDVLGGCVLGFAIPQILGTFLAYNFLIHVEDRRYLFHYSA